MLARLRPLLFVLVLSACPRKQAPKPFEPTACERFGQNCEVSPGKLGSCVERTDCSGPNCLICQSQH